MTGFVLENFMGIMPRLDPRLLPANAAQIALNCKLLTGVIRALYRPKLVNTPTKTGTLTSIYRLDDGAGTDTWLHWTEDVDVVRSPVADLYADVKRIYFTSDEWEPRVSNLEMASLGSDTVDGSDIYPATYGDAGTDYPLAYYALGVPPPLTPPTLGTPSGGAGTDEDRSYVYTFVNAWGEESAPSPASIIQTGKPDGTWPLSNMDIAPLNTGATIVNATHSSGTVTVETAGYHSLKVGHYFNISGVVGMTDINDDYRVKGITNISAKTVSRARNANVVTLILDDVTGLAANMYVVISGVSGGGYNGTFQLVSVTAATNAITYAEVAGNEVTTADTGGQLIYSAFEISQTTAQAYTSGGTWKRYAPYNTANMTKRIYRTLTDDTGYTDYQFVAEIAAATTTHDDSLTLAELGESITSINHDMPHGLMQGIVSMPNGFHAGFVGNEVHFSVPFKPYTYPDDYKQLVDFPIVGLGVHETSTIAMTTSLPYEIYAIHPESASINRIDKLSYPCKSKQGIVSHGMGVVYPSDRGLVAISASYQGLVTKDFYTRDEWQDLVVPESMISFTYDDRYYGFWEDANGDGKAIIYDPFEVRSQITQNNQALTGAYSDPETGLAYLIDSTIKQWDADLAYRQSYQWRSRKIKTPKPINPGACRIEADFSMSAEESAAIDAQNVTITAANAAIIAAIPVGVDKVSNLEGCLGGAAVGEYAVGEDILADLVDSDPPSIGFTLYAKKDDGTIVLRCNKEITQQRTFRLPDGYKSDEFEVEVTGNVDIAKIKIAETPKELELA